MRVFVCTDHDGYYPVGVASVVVAVDEGEARSLLLAELTERGLRGNGTFTLREINATAPRAFVLHDGDY